MYHIILWLSLILASVFAMVNNEIYLSLSLFLIFVILGSVYIKNSQATKISDENSNQTWVPFWSSVRMR